MIQRIQTAFLALASLLGFSLFLNPMDFLSSKVVEGSSIFADGVFDIQDHISLIILTAIIGLIPLVAIFLFKNRKMQMTLGKLSIAAIFILALVAGYFYYDMTTKVTELPPVNPQIGIAAPILSLVFLFLANKFIKKDDKLVRSADRLR